MSKNLEILKKLPVVQLKRVLTDYNKKLQKKEYKGVASMRKNEIIDELNKMYTWKHKDEKVSFLRKGKQHSFVLGIRGYREANQDYAERMEKKKARKKAISKVLLKKKVVGRKAPKKLKKVDFKEVEDLINQTKKALKKSNQRKKKGAKKKKLDDKFDERYMIKDK